MCAPRARACSSSSSTTTAAPSAITNPSRSAVERARGGRRVVVSARERPHRAEAGDPDRGHRRLGAAAEHDVGAAEPDRVQAVADRHARRGTGARLREQRPARAELDRHPARGKVRQGLHDRERADPLRTAAVELQDAILEGSDPAERARDRHTDALGVRPDVELRVGLGLARRCKREMRAPVHAAHRLVVDVVGDLQPLDLAREPRRIVGGVELRDRRRSGFTPEQRLP